jgi:hypothetical protein
LAASIFGPGRVTAARTVPGKAGEVLEAIDAWMQRQETLIVKRHHSDRIVWEPSRDFGVVIRRAFKPGGRDFALANAFEVGATVIAVDDAHAHVILDADFQPRRTRGSLIVAGIAGAGGILSGGLLFTALPAIVAVAPAVAVTAISVAGGRQVHKRVVTRAHLALEQLLDRLERGELKRRGADSLLGAIVAAATSSVPPRRLCRRRRVFAACFARPRTRAPSTPRRQALGARCRWPSRCRSIRMICASWFAGPRRKVSHSFRADRGAACLAARSATD